MFSLHRKKKTFLKQDQTLNDTVEQTDEQFWVEQHSLPENRATYLTWHVHKKWVLIEKFKNTGGFLGNPGSPTCVFFPPYLTWLLKCSGLKAKAIWTEWHTSLCSWWCAHPLLYLASLLHCNHLSLFVRYKASVHPKIPSNSQCETGS